MQDFLTGLAFFLVIEGVIYALFPESVKRMGREVQKIPAPNLRIAGLIAMAIGVGSVWLMRG